MNPLRNIVFAFVPLVLLALPVSAAAGDAPDIEAMIESAATKADHAAVAEYFERAAEEARADADRHSRMAARYQKLGGPQVEKWHLDRHCRGLVKSYRSAAEENEALATAHRTIADNMK